MLQRATAKSAAAPTGPSSASMPGWIEADALNLPFPSAHFDLVTSAFGFRNLADYDAGLREIVRVLRPGGECGILDFGEPKGAMGALYRIYFKQVLPRSRHDDFRRAWSLCLPAGLGRALPAAGRNAGADEERWLCRSDLDALHIRNRRPLSREEIIPNEGKCKIGCQRKKPGCARRTAEGRLPLISARREAVCLVPQYPRPNIADHKIAQPVCRPVLHVE